ncbi:glycoside hydrolase family 3 N-terminal domain-containing protein [Desulfobotulus mexicanus]|uniref:beta-N-acetylhexosaminidase n=1 Tax=Desulfobotulus mexicanus TaxID=2586642 RepID=A0A5S5MF54_9BACT|nr:glycoside hydrolase family 3 N-terminal domain-containing protein [Desulfobotulus mexicanus]TYT74309.1 glycoside hydrolase family 3 protein [Desulfobotulus mexicanus]
MSLYSPEQWSPRKLAGQRLMIGFEGPVCDERIRSLIARIFPAGVVLFSTNVRNPEQLIRLNRDLQSSAKEAGLPPLIIAMDQEGGNVARLREPDFREFAPISELKSTEEAREHARCMAVELKALGITMNLAPVLDVADKDTSIMKKRAFTGDARAVTDMGLAMISAYRQEGIHSVAKHFPGIGRTILDSHHVLPRLDAEKSLLAVNDFLPFGAAIKADVDGIMVSHILYGKLDPEWPASLSSIISRDLLRNEMGYEGVVMTDDLDMKAIRLPMEKVMERMVLAEIDLGLICHEGPAIDEAFSTLLFMAEKEENKASFIQSAKRILRIKKNRK